MNPWGMVLLCCSFLFSTSRPIRQQKRDATRDRDIEKHEKQGSFSSNDERALVFILFSVCFCFIPVPR